VVDCRAVVRIGAAPQVQLFTSEGNGWPHNAPQVSLARVKQAAATSETARRCWLRVSLMYRAGLRHVPGVRPNQAVNFFFWGGAIFTLKIPYKLTCQFE